MLEFIIHFGSRANHARQNSSHILILEQPTLDTVWISKPRPMASGLSPWRHSPMPLTIRTRANITSILTSEWWNTTILPSYYAFHWLDSYAESVITVSQLCCQRLTCSGTRRRVVRVIKSAVSKDRNAVSEPGDILVLPVVQRSCPSDKHNTR